MKTYTVKVDNNGNKRWYSNDELHREDGPAIEFADGDKHWWINGQRLTEQEVLNLLQTLELEKTWPGSTSKWWALKKVA